MNKVLFLLFIGVPLLLVQSIWIFLDARKRGERYYWLWGLLGLLNVPSSLVIYLIVTRTGQEKCKSCGKGVKKGLKSCPYCGINMKSRCPNCGSEIENDWEYCPECNNKLRRS